MYVIMGAQCIVGTHTVLVQIWQDDRLRWDPSEYAGVDKLRISQSRIWTPDLRLFNALVNHLCSAMLW